MRQGGDTILLWTMSFPARSGKSKTTFCLAEGVEMGVRIAILGVGNVAASLAPVWIAAGHDVVFGARDRESPKAVALRERLGDESSILTIGDAIADSQVVVLAVTGSAVLQLVAEHTAGLADRILIDATNYVAGGSSEKAGLVGVRRALSITESIRDQVPNARVFRAFNHYGWEVFACPVFAGQAAALFYCGPPG